MSDRSLFISEIYWIHDLNIHFFDSLQDSEKPFHASHTLKGNTSSIELRSRRKNISLIFVECHVDRTGYQSQ